MTEPAPRSRREMVFALVVLVLGALVTLVAAGQSRVTLGLVGEQISGGRTPAGRALALVALAGAGAVILARSWLRVTLGLLLLACAAGGAAAFLSRDAGAVGGFAFTPASSVIALRRSTWAWTGAGGCLMIGLAAAAVVLRGRHWPGSRRGFDPPSPRPGPAARPRDPWVALDSGEDPTV